MRIKATRVFLLTLAVLLLVVNLLHYPFYLFTLHEIKAEIQREIFQKYNVDAHRSVTLKFTEEEFYNLEVNDHELVIGEEWYDIIATNYSNDGTVTLTCYDDSKESLLQTWFKKTTDEQHSSSSEESSSSKLMKSLSVSDYEPMATLETPVSTSESIALHSAMQPVAIQTGYHALPEHPPRA